MTKEQGEVFVGTRQELFQRILAMPLEDPEIETIKDGGLYVIDHFLKTVQDLREVIEEEELEYLNYAIVIVMMAEKDVQEYLGSIIEDMDASIVGSIDESDN